MERNNGFGNEMELNGCLWVDFLRVDNSRLAKWNDSVDLWSGMKKPPMLWGAEVGEMN